MGENGREVAVLMVVGGLIEARFWPRKVKKIDFKV
jgi:hypothetical protein